MIHLTGSISSSPMDKIVSASRQALIQENDSLPMARILKRQGIECTEEALRGSVGIAIVCLKSRQGRACQRELFRCGEVVIPVTPGRQDMDDLWSR